MQDFNPESVKVLHDIDGHQVVAVIRFQNSMDGFKDAEAFEHSFCCQGWGRSDFEKDYPNGCGTHLYGWMASNMVLSLSDHFNLFNYFEVASMVSNGDRILVQDVEGSSKLLGDYLKANGDLKSLPEIVRELEAKAQQQVQILKEVLIRKEEALLVAHQENWSLMNKVAYVTAQVEQAQQEKKKLIEDYEKGKVVHSWL